MRRTAVLLCQAWDKNTVRVVIYSCSLHFFLSLSPIPSLFFFSLPEMIRADLELEGGGVHGGGGVRSATVPSQIRFVGVLDRVLGRTCSSIGQLACNNWRAILVS